jgi:hypothetical protein
MPKLDQISWRNLHLLRTEVFLCPVDQLCALAVRLGADSGLAAESVAALGAEPCRNVMLAEIRAAIKRCIQRGAHPCE